MGSIIEPILYLKMDKRNIYNISMAYIGNILMTIILYLHYGYNIVLYNEVAIISFTLFIGIFIIKFMKGGNK